MEKKFKSRYNRKYSQTHSADSKPSSSQVRNSSEPSRSSVDVKDATPVDKSEVDGVPKVDESMMGTQESDDIPMIQKLKEMNQSAK